MSIKTRLISISASLSMLLSSCSMPEEFGNDAYGNFDALWTIIDEHYCFFAEKDIDWTATGRKYRGKISGEMTYDEFFTLLGDMLAELKDGHVNLSSQFNTSFYRKWWTDYPQDFNLRTLQQYYLGFDYHQVSGIIYKLLGKDKSVGYMYLPSFSSQISDASLDNVLNYFRSCRAIIIDIRDNGGGMLTNVSTLVSRFISSDFLAGYISHKTGPAHDAFSEPYPIIYHPSERIRWEKPVYLLTNRSSFSAANDFASVMKQIPGVKLVGATTGGGGGMPFSSELPIGWSVRFSASPITDADGNSTENGIDPTPGYEMHASAKELAEGYDAILDFALKAAMSGEIK